MKLFYLALLTTSLWALGARIRAAEADGDLKEGASSSSGFDQKHADQDQHYDASFDHKVVAGSQQAAEKFKEMEPRDARRRLNVIIDRIDADKDEHVSAEELRQWIHNSLINIDKESAKKKLEELDENQDKRVSWKEYVHKTYGYNLEDLPQLEKEKTESVIEFLAAVRRQKEKFMHADESKDGKLDLNEFAGFNEPANYPHMAAVHVRHQIEEHDKNKDGKLSVDEFLGEAANASNPDLDRAFIKEEQDRFASFDRNKDGFLDASEALPWAMPGFEGDAKREQVHLFKHTDKDGDGRLSKDEILDNYELWVGSQATDGGAHLRKLKNEEL